jgi:hypothetical protein
MNNIIMARFLVHLLLKNNQVTPKLRVFFYVS